MCVCVLSSDSFMHVLGAVSLLHVLSVWTSIRKKIVFLQGRDAGNVLIIRLEK